MTNYGGRENMTTEVQVCQLKLVEGGERFPAKLAEWIKTIYRWLRGKEGKTWNSKKW